MVGLERFYLLKNGKERDYQDQDGLYVKAIVIAF